MLSILNLICPLAAEDNKNSNYWLFCIKFLKINFFEKLKTITNTIFLGSKIMLNLSSNSSQEFLQVIPYKLLKRLIMDGVSGRLVIQNPFDEYVNWQVYLGNGKIYFANSAVGLVERLSYLALLLSVW